MKKGMLFLLTAVAATVVSVNVYAQDECCGNEPWSVNVTGYAEREIVPNQIFMNITIDENDPKSVKSKMSLEQLENEMIKAVKGLGIDVDKKLTVEGISSELQDFVLRRAEARTSKTYQLEVGDAVMLSKVVVALEKAGISNISVSRVAHTDVEKIKNELRVEAVKNAKEIATSMIEALGQKIYGAIYLEDTRYPGAMYDGVMVGYASRKASNEAAVETYPLSFKNIKLTHSVNAKFAIRNIISK